MIRYFQKHKELTIILFLSFIIRLFLAGWNSYWYDELLSVYKYGVVHKNIFEAITALAEKSVHPPLYQIILFGWMKIFGYTEVATRLLSTLFVMLSTLFLYLFADRLFNRRIAIASILIYSLSYSIIYYSLETRSYALSLFLCTFSSFVFLKFIENIKDNFSWRFVFLNKLFLSYTIINLMLLLTHYYNGFFIFAQGIFVLAYFCFLNRSTSFLKSFTKVAIIYFAQIILFIATWGPVAFLTYRRYSSGGAYAVDTPSKNPVSIFMDMVFKVNYDFSLVILMVLVLFFIWLIFIKIRNIIICFKKGINPYSDFLFFYLLFWAFLPCVAAYICFFGNSFERYSPRYFLFCIPPLSILFVLIFDKIVESFSALAKDILYQHYLRYSILYAIIISIIISLPGGYKAAIKKKADWRGIANQIVEVIKNDFSHKYVVYETTFGDLPTLDYYFKQNSENVRVYGTIRRYEEKIAGKFRFENAKNILLKYDYIVVVFTHHRVGDFPLALKKLNENFKIYFRNIDQQGRGFIVFKVAN